jgi:hypothetical protein
VEQTFPGGVTGAEQPVAPAIQRILERTGVNVVALGQPCETSLLVTLNFQPQGDNYPGLLDSKDHYCYTGALVKGELRLEAHGQEARLWPVLRRRDTIEGIISHCPGPSEAPFDKVWPYAVLDILGEIKGPAVYYQSLADENEDVSIFF